MKLDFSRVVADVGAACQKVQDTVADYTNETGTILDVEEAFRELEFLARDNADLCIKFIKEKYDARRKTVSIERVA